MTYSFIVIFSIFWYDISMTLNGRRYWNKIIIRGIHLSFSVRSSTIVKVWRHIEENIWIQSWWYGLFIHPLSLDLPILYKYNLKYNEMLEHNYYTPYSFIFHLSVLDSINTVTFYWLKYMNTILLWLIHLSTDFNHSV